MPFFAGEILLFRDALQALIPHQLFAAHELHQGRLATWFPLLYGGAPLLAEPCSSVLYPPNLLFHLIGPERAAAALVLIHLPLAGAGALAMARVLGCTPVASAVAGTVFAGSGYLASMHGGHCHFAGTAWMPLCVALLLQAAAKGGRWIAAAAGALGMMALNGELQTLGLTVGVAMVLALVASGEGAPPRRAGRLAGAVVLGAALGAAQLWPSALFARTTVRAHGMSVEQSSTWALHPVRWIEFLLPAPFGMPFPDNSQWNAPLLDGVRTAAWAPMLYLGPAALLLAAWALLGPRPRPRAAWAVTALLAMALAVAAGAHFPIFAAWHRFVPGADFFRYPEKYASVATLALAMLAGLGLSALDRAAPENPGDADVRLTGGRSGSAPENPGDADVRPPGGRSGSAPENPGDADVLRPPGGRSGPERPPGSLTRAAGLLGAGLAAAALGVWLGRASYLPVVAELLARSGANVGPETAVGGLSWSLFHASLVALALAAALRTARPGWLAPAVLVLAFLDAGTVGPRAWSWGDAGIFAAPPPLVAAVRRVMAPGSAGRFWRQSSCSYRGGGEGRTLLERVRAFDWATGKPNFLTRAGLADAVGYGSAESADKWRVWREVAGARGVEDAARLFGAAVAIECPSSGQVRARPVERPLPRAFLVAGPAEDANALLDGREEIRPVPVRDDAPTQVVIRAEGPATLVLLDSWAEGWTATVDGSPAAVERAYGLFRKVRLEAGPSPHEVVFRYQAPGLAPGLATSAVALLAIAWLLVRRRSKVS